MPGTRRRPINAIFQRRWTLHRPRSMDWLLLLLKEGIATLLVVRCQTTFAGGRRLVDGHQTAWRCRMSYFVDFGKEAFLVLLVASVDDAQSVHRDGRHADRESRRQAQTFQFFPRCQTVPSDVDCVVGGRCLDADERNSRVGHRRRKDSDTLLGCDAVNS